jgi:translation elongation factor EF-1beta
MGDVAATYKIFVEDMEKFNEVKVEIQKLNPKAMVEEEVGFGIKVIKAVFIIGDVGGEIDKLEASLSAIKGVSEIRSEEVGRML